jgi:mRNA interferase MazF
VKSISPSSLFGDAPGRKIRPVLLLTDPVEIVPEILVAYISSVIPTRLLPSDLLLNPSIPEFRSTNLKTSSALRLHKLATIHCSSLARYLGVVDERHWSVVASKLKDLLRL